MDIKYVPWIRTLSGQKVSLYSCDKNKSLQKNRELKAIFLTLQRTETIVVKGVKCYIHLNRPELQPNNEHLNLCNCKPNTSMGKSHSSPGKNFADTKISISFPKQLLQFSC